MKWPAWYRLGRIVFSELYYLLHNPLISIFLGYAFAMANMYWTVKQIQPVIDSSWALAIAQAVKSCEAAGK